MREGTTALTADAIAREFAAMGGRARRSASGRTRPTIVDRRAWPIRRQGGAADCRRRATAAASRIRAGAGQGQHGARPRDPAEHAAVARAGEIRRALYGDHPYGRLFPTEAMLSGYTLDQVRAFHRDHFTAGRARFTSPACSTPRRWKRRSGRRSTAGPRARPRKPRRPSRHRARAASRCSIGRRAAVDGHARPPSARSIARRLGGARRSPTRFSAARSRSRITANIREQKGYTYSPVSSIDTHPGVAHWVETADVTTNVTGRR